MTQSAEKEGGKRGQMERAGEYTNEMVENKGINVKVSKKIKTLERKKRKNLSTDQQGVQSG